MTLQARIYDSPHHASYRRRTTNRAQTTHGIVDSAETKGTAQFCTGRAPRNAACRGSRTVPCPASIMSTACWSVLSSLCCPTAELSAEQTIATICPSLWSWSPLSPHVCRSRGGPHGEMSPGMERGLVGYVPKSARKAPCVWGSCRGIAASLAACLPRR